MLLKAYMCDMRMDTHAEIIFYPNLHISRFPHDESLSPDDRLFSQQT